MKRSEMIQKLHDIINSKLYQDYQFSEEELAEILTEIEEAGMLPPERPETLADNDSGCEDEGSFTILINKWEDE